MNSPEHSEKIIMQGIHFELTEAMQNIIREKFDPILRHNERIIRVNVRVHMNQTIGGDHIFTATSQIEIPGPDLNAHVSDKDAYAAIDQLVEKLDRLLRRRHGKRKDKRNHPRDIELEAELPKIT